MIFCTCRANFFPVQYYQLDYFSGLYDLKQKDLATVSRSRYGHSLHPGAFRECGYPYDPVIYPDQQAESSECEKPAG